MKRSDNHREGNIFEFFSPGNEGNVVTRKRLVERDDDLLLGMQLLLSEMITRRRERREMWRIVLPLEKKKKETNRSRDPKWWINEPRINKEKSIQAHLSRLFRPLIIGGVLRADTHDARGVFSTIAKRPRDNACID